MGKKGTTPLRTGATTLGETSSTEPLHHNELSDQDSLQATTRNLPRRAPVFIVHSGSAPRRPLAAVVLRRRSSSYQRPPFQFLARLRPVHLRAGPERRILASTSVPASAPIPRLLPAPDASRELLVPRASAPRSGGACEAARGRWVAAGCRFLLVSRRLRVSPLSGAAPTSECLGAGYGGVADLISAHGRPSSPSPSPLHARRSSAAPAIQLQTAVFRASYRRAPLGTRLEH